MNCDLPLRVTIIVGIARAKHAYRLWQIKYIEQEDDETMRSRMKKADVENYLSRRSYELAESGDYGDYMSIDFALRVEGYPEARGFLDSRVRRWELNNLCNQARRTRGLPLSPVAADRDQPFCP